MTRYGIDFLGCRFYYIMRTLFNSILFINRKFSSIIMTIRTELSFINHFVANPDPQSGSSFKILLLLKYKIIINKDLFEL